MKLFKNNQKEINVENSLFIGTNILLTINLQVKAFELEVKDNVINIPFTATDTRYNLDFLDVISQVRNQGRHKIYAITDTGRNLIRYSGTNIQENEYSWIAAGRSYRFAFHYTPTHQLRLVAFNDENWAKIECENLADSKKLKITSFQHVGNYVNFFVEEGELNGLFELSLQSLLDERKIDLKFWIFNNRLTVDWRLFHNNKLFSLMETGQYQLVASYQLKNVTSKRILYIDQPNTQIYRTSSWTPEGMYQVDVYANLALFVKLSYEQVGDWVINEKIHISPQKLLIPLKQQVLDDIDSVYIKVKKTGECHDVVFEKKDQSLIIYKSELTAIKANYIIQLFVMDKEGRHHQLSDKSRKGLANIYRHFPFDKMDNLKTYAYFTINGRLGFYRSFLPIEVLKATDVETVDAQLDSSLLTIKSDKKFEALVKDDYKSIETVNLTQTIKGQQIDLKKINMMPGKEYELLLKKVGNHDFKKVKSTKNIFDEGSDYAFNSSNLQFHLVTELKLSIVVTFYNTQMYLDKLFSSLYRQGLAESEFEILAVNDASTDNSLQVARKYARQYGNFHIITHKENKGLGEARNTGIVAANGKYLTFVDGDDFIADGAYKKMLNIITRTHSQVITGGVKRWRNNKPEISWLYRKIFVKNIERTSLSQNPELVYDTTAWNKLYDREWFVSKGFKYPTMLYEDIPVTIPVFQLADSIDIFSSTMYYWFIRDTSDDKSITNNRTQLSNIEDRLKAIQSAIASLKNNKVALIEYETKIVKVDIPIYLRHFRSVEDDYLALLMEASIWALGTFTEESLSTLSDREMARLKCTAEGDFEKLIDYYNEDELA